MLKFYVITCVIATVLNLAVGAKGIFNKNVKDYMKKNWSLKKKWYQEVYSFFKTIAYGCIPVFNLLLIGAYIFTLFASDLTLIKLMKKQKQKEDREKIELDRLMNQENN